MKVKLVNEKRYSTYVGSSQVVAPISATLPFFEREGDGYVHRVRSASIHYDKAGNYLHTLVQFWCGGHGHIHMDGVVRKKVDPKRRKQKRAVLVENPSLGRVVCATCQGRAFGAGQLGSHKVNGQMSRFKPHGEFFPLMRKGACND